MISGKTAQTDLPEFSLLDHSILLVFLALALALRAAAEQSGQDAVLLDWLLLGALTGLSLTRLLLYFPRAKLRMFGSDWILLAWCCGASFVALHARLRFAALEELRNVLIVPVVYFAASGALYHLKKKSLILCGLFALLGTGYLAIQNPAAFAPPLWIAYAGIGFFALLALRPDCETNSGGRMFRKVLLACFVLVFCGSFYGIFALNRAGTAERLYWQRNFQRDQFARMIAGQRPLLGIGGGNFDWFVSANLGPEVRDEHRGGAHAPWPALAEMGAPNFLLFLAFLFSGMFLFPYRGSGGADSHSCCNASLRCALLLWIFCGFTAGFLFEASGLLAAAFIAGMLRGQRSACAGNAAASSQIAQPTAPIAPRKKIAGLHGAGAFCIAACLILLCSAALALPEIARLLCRHAAPDQPAFELGAALYPLHPEINLLTARKLAALDETSGGKPRDGAYGLNQITEQYYLALDANPLDESIYLELRRWLKDRLNDPVESGKILERGARNCPGSFEIARQLAAQQLQAKRFGRALELLLPFETRHLGDPAFVTALAYCYQALDQPLRAQFYRDIAVQQRAGIQ